MSARDDLEDHWRWQYDILVYPKEAQEYQGLRDGWTAPQTSIASYGGISEEDLYRIEKIPGVELVAPLSLIGFFDYDHVLALYEGADSGELYETDYVRKVFDGLRDIILVNNTTYREFVDLNVTGETLEQVMEDSKNFRYQNLFRSIGPPSQQIRIPNKMLVVAVDPKAEERLYGLTDAVIGGENLLDAEVVVNQAMHQPVIPILALHDIGIEGEDTVNVSRVEVPKGIDLWELEGDAISYLEGFPKTPLAELRLNPYSPDMRFKNVSLIFSRDGITERPYITRFGDRFLQRYAAIQFQDLEEARNGIPLLHAEGSLQEKLLSQMGPSATYHVYREELEMGQDFIAFGIDVIGYYDANLIEPQYASSWQKGDPIDLYTPQHSMILADGTGNPVDPRPLVPLPMKDAYYTGAPDALTTMEVAKIFYGDDPPISSIRVVVSGVEERSEESQRKIEQIATEIMEKTGHNVEIMLGSSAGKSTYSTRRGR